MSCNIYSIEFKMILEYENKHQKFKNPHYLSQCVLCRLGLCRLYIACLACLLVYALNCLLPIYCVYTVPCAILHTSICNVLYIQLAQMLFISVYNNWLEANQNMSFSSKALLFQYFVSPLLPSAPPDGNGSRVLVQRVTMSTSVKKLEVDVENDKRASHFFSNVQECISGGEPFHVLYNLFK